MYAQALVGAEKIRLQSQVKFHRSPDVPARIEAYSDDMKKSRS
jgi:hypothetical protein